jgi:hypothetical protein
VISVVVFLGMGQGNGSGFAYYYVSLVKIKDMMVFGHIQCLIFGCLSQWEMLKAYRNYWHSSYRYSNWVLEENIDSTTNGSRRKSCEKNVQSTKDEGQWHDLSIVLISVELHVNHI